MDKICGVKDWRTHIVAERKLRLKGALPGLATFHLLMLALVNTRVFFKSTRGGTGNFGLR